MFKREASTTDNHFKLCQQQIKIEINRERISKQTVGRGRELQQQQRMSRTLDCVDLLDLQDRAYRDRLITVRDKLLLILHEAEDDIINITSASASNLDLQSGKSTVPGSPVTDYTLLESPEGSSTRDTGARTPGLDSGLVYLNESATTPSRVRVSSPAVSPAKVVQFRKNSPQASPTMEPTGRELLQAIQDLSNTFDQRIRQLEGRHTPAPEDAPGDPRPSAEVWASLVQPEEPLLQMEDSAALRLALALKAKTSEMTAGREKHQAQFLLNLAADYPELPERTRKLIMHRINILYIAATKG
uniref:Uncharacterized protein n=1 Tax=Timema cristinae TaxID=61476 RepID=A0A7R9H044_TIMCR|nr:unnamed protein product [Timema cristinae]